MARSRKPSSTDRGVLDLPARDALSLHALVEAGLRWSSIERLGRALALPLAQLAELVRIPPRTLSRRRADGRFDPHESERLVRLARVLDLAVELFEGDLPAARHWLASPQAALGGAPPLDLTRTEVGAREVEALLGRLEHGIPS